MDGILIQAKQAELHVQESCNPCKIEEKKQKREKRTAKDGNETGQVDQEVENAGQEAEKADKCSQDVSQEVELAQAADDVVAGEIGGSDNDTDQAEHPVVAMVRKESDCDGDDDSDGFDDE